MFSFVRFIVAVAVAFSGGMGYERFVGPNRTCKAVNVELAKRGLGEFQINPKNGEIVFVEKQ